VGERRWERKEKKTSRDGRTAYLVDVVNVEIGYTGGIAHVFEPPGAERKKTEKNEEWAHGVPGYASVAHGVTNVEVEYRDQEEEEEEEAEEEEEEEVEEEEEEEVEEEEGRGVLGSELTCQRGAR
jgi:hypothetical protein